MKRIAQGLGLLALLAVGLLALLYALRGAVLAPRLTGALVAAVEEATGLTLEVGALTGTYWADLALVEVRTVRPAPEGPVRAVAARELRVSYNLWALVSGWETFLGSVAVDLSGARIEVVLGAGEGAEATPQAGPEAPLILPRTLPTVRLRDTTLMVRGPDYWVDLAGIALDVGPTRGTSTPLRMTVAELAWDHPALRPGAVAVAAELMYAPEELLLHTLTLDGRLAAEKVRVGLAELPRVVPVRGELAAFGGQAGFEARIEASRFDARVTLTGLAVEEALALLAAPPPDLTGRLFAEASAAGAWDHPERLTAAVTARLEGGRVAGALVEQLTLEAAASAGQARVESLLARVEGNQVELSGVAFSLDAVLAGAAAQLLGQVQGEFRAEFTDLSPLLALAGLEVPPLPAHRVEVAGSVGDGRVAIAVGDATVGANTAAVREVILPLVALAQGDVEALVGSSRGNFRVEFRDIPALATLAGMQVERAAPVHRLTLAGAVGEERVALSEGRFTAVGAEVLLERAQLELPATPGAQWQDAAVEAEVQVEVADLAGVAALFGGEAAAGAVQGRLSLMGTVGAPRGRLQLNGRELAWGGFGVDAAVVEATVESPRLELTKLLLERGGDRLAGHGAYQMDQALLDAVVLDLSADDLGFYLRDLMPDLELSEGTLSAHLEVAGPLTAPAGSLSLRGGAAVVAGVAVEQVALRVSAENGNLRVDEVSVRSDQGALALTGTATLPAADGAWQAELVTLELHRGEVGLALQAPAQVAGNLSGRISVNALELAGEVGTVTMGGRFDPAGEIDLTLAVADFTGRGWLETLVGERAAFRGAALRARLTGSIAHPSLALVGQVEELHVEGAPFPLHGNLDMDAGPFGIFVHQLELQGDLGTGVSIRGELPYDPLAEVPLLPGPFSLHAVADVPSLGPLVALFVPEWAVGGFAKGSLDLEGTWEEPRGRLRFAGGNLTLPAAWQPQPPSPLEVEGDLVFADDRVEVELLRLTATGLDVSATGALDGAPDLSRLLRGEPRNRKSTVVLKSQVAVSDLSWLVRDVEAVRRLGGSARAELTLEGPLTDPVFTAGLDLSEGEVLLNGPLPGLRALSGRLTADRNTLRVERLGGELGGGPFRVTGQVARDSAGEYHPDLRLQGDDLLLFRNDGVKLRADTDLRVAGSLSALHVSGALSITDGRFVKNVDFLSLLQGRSAPQARAGLNLFSFPEPPLRDARLDVAIGAKTPFLLKNNLVNGGVRPDLRLTGTGELPVLLGTVYLEPTRLRLPAGRLVVESGVVQFLARDPDRPRLDLHAATKMIGYDIAMQVAGPYDEPVVTLSSNPPLPNEDLLLLVFAGVPPRSTADRNTAQQSGMMMATYLGRNMLGELVGDESTESQESMLDRFDLLIGQGVTRRGEETIEATFRLKEDLIREGDALYLRSEKDVYDAYNAGVRFVVRFE